MGSAKRASTRSAGIGMGPYVTSHAYDVSGDGSVIVGEVGGHAFRFDRGSSPRLLRELANSTAGSSAHAISDNGEWIVAAALLPCAITSARVGYRCAAEYFNTSCRPRDCSKFPHPAIKSRHPTTSTRHHDTINQLQSHHPRTNDSRPLSPRPSHYRNAPR